MSHINPIEALRVLEAEALAAIADAGGAESLEHVRVAYLGRSEGGCTMPGQINLVAVDAQEPAGKPIRECKKQTVTLTVSDGECASTPASQMIHVNEPPVAALQVVPDE